ncbi:MAG TPA: Rieske 2Fe-2S domain-containing protein [Actinomycetota bacterium]|jgi:cytochrome b6-f complex iron-sulfur subunit
MGDSALASVERLSIAVASSPKSAAILIVGALTALFLFILLLSLVQTRRGSPARPAAHARMADASGATAPGHPVSRRDLFRGGLMGSLLLFAAQFGGASIAFLWPNLKGQFGSVVAAGTLSDINSFVTSQKQPFYNGAGRFYIVPYSGSGAHTVYEGLVQQGLMALYQRCVHLGCRVPFCQASQWFECPCHGSKYNEAGEYQLGPAPRGLDRFKLAIGPGGQVSVDTSTIVMGPPRGTNTTNQGPEGPFCVGGAAGG